MFYDLLQSFDSEIVGLVRDSILQLHEGVIATSLVEFLSHALHEHVHLTLLGADHAELFVVLVELLFDLVMGLLQLFLSHYSPFDGFKVRLGKELVSESAELVVDTLTHDVIGDLVDKPGFPIGGG